MLAAIERDQNSVADYDIDQAITLATLKLVGYTQVVHVLLPRLSADASIVLFGGLAKDRPYPGSTTVSTVNGGIVGLVRSLVDGAHAHPRQLDPPGDRRRQPVLVQPAGGAGGHPGPHADGQAGGDGGHRRAPARS